MSKRKFTPPTLLDWLLILVAFILLLSIVQVVVSNTKAEGWQDVYSASESACLSKDPGDVDNYGFRDKVEAYNASLPSAGYPVLSEDLGTGQRWCDITTAILNAKDRA